MTDVPSPATSRRRLIALTLGAAVGGAAWASGLSILARGRHPQVFVLGDDVWQIVLVEHGTNRVIVLVGVFERSPEPEIDLLCGVLRQHLDVVIGDEAGLRFLSPGFRERRSVSTVVQMDGSRLLSSAERHISLVDPLTLRAGAFGLTLTPLLEVHWNSRQSLVGEWIGHLTLGDLAIAIAPTLETIAQHAPVPTTMAIAPSGDIARVWRTLPGIVIATNSRLSLAEISAGVPTERSTTLVRTFPRDTAAFVFKEDRIHLPDWTQGSDT